MTYDKTNGIAFSLMVEPAIGNLEGNLDILLNFEGRLAGKKQVVVRKHRFRLAFDLLASREDGSLEIDEPAAGESASIGSLRAGP